MADGVIVHGPDSPVARRLRLALEMFEFGVAMQRARLRRLYPDEDDEAIGARIRDWLRTRPGAEHGDAWGRPVVPPTVGQSGAGRG